MTTTVHTTRRDAIQREIAPALVEHGGDFDVEGMADDMLEWVSPRDKDGNQVASRTGYVLREDVDFWEVAARHDWAIRLEAAGASFAEARDERRRLVLEAVRGGMAKSRAASLAGVSRPTLDKWLAEA